MNITADKIERLVFVKYLLLTTEKSKDLDRPLSSSAILTLHDSVECFLQLVYEQLTGKNKPSGHLILETYTDKINEILLSEQKPQINKSYIKRINELRNQLKHSTIFIDNRNIQNLYTETEIFLNDFCELIFNLDFNNISLLLLIQNNEVKDYLLNAENDFANGSLQSAMFSIGKAFYILEEFDTKEKDQNGEKYIATYRKIDYFSKYRIRLDGNKPDPVLRENLKEIGQDLNRLQEELLNLKKTISLKVDLKSYKKFKTIIPFVTKITKIGTNEVEFWIPDETKGNIVNYNKDQVKFCMDFVLELALKQEY